MEARLISLLKSSLQQSQLKQIQALIITTHPNLTSLFFNFLSTPSNIHYAYQLFDVIPQPHPLFANSIISTLSKLSLHQKVLKTFFLAHQKDTQIVYYSVAPVLKACASLGVPIEGKQVHSLVISRGTYSNVFIQSALIYFYSKNGELDSAKKVSDEVKVKEPVPYNCLISGYSKSGNVLAARKLFDEMPCRTQASWNMMITCYAHQGEVSEALKLFERMQEEKFQPNERTLV